MQRTRRAQGPLPRPEACVSHPTHRSSGGASLSHCSTVPRGRPSSLHSFSTCNKAQRWSRNRAHGAVCRSKSHDTGQRTLTCRRPATSACCSLLICHGSSSPADALTTSRAARGGRHGSRKDAAAGATEHCMFVFEREKTTEWRDGHETHMHAL